MGKTAIDDSRYGAQVLTGSGNIIEVKWEGRIKVETPTGCYGIWEQPGGSGNKAVVNGSIWAMNPNGDGRGIYAQGDDFTVRVGTRGLLQGQVGLEATGMDLTVVNKGRIEGLGPTWGITALAGAEIHNDGVISGRHAVSLRGDSKIVNSGNILASGDAIQIYGPGGEKTMIVNHGLLRGDIYSIFDYGVGNQTVRNDGRIVGNMYLGTGNDTVDTRGGTIVGMIDGGAGNDTLITDSAKYTLTEYAGEGFDTVKSTVSYTLTDNVEKLVLLGRKNINATGNDGGVNYLYGNAGNNVLRGHDGYNELFGRGGRDTLIGGADYDLFGLGKGYGRDTVRNFQDGTDQIDIYKLGVDTYAELKPHIKQHGDDTWIAFGKDILILEGIDRSALDASDFLFNY